MTEAPPKQRAESGLKPGERPTLKTISQMTGLAIATVSRALHDAPDIGSNTKKRVHEVADQIGYRPNRAGVRLRTGKTNVISLVLSTDHDMMNHTARLISSIAATLRETPYHMIITPFYPSEDPMTPVRYLVETQSADGLIMNQTQPRDPRVAYLMKQGFPFATHGRTDWSDQHAYYDFDNRRFGQIGAEEFAKRGRKNVLLVAPPLHQNYARNIVDGLQTRAAELGLNVDILPDPTSDSASAEIEAAFARYMINHPKVDAVLCSSTNTAMAVVAIAEDMGRVIGTDIDVCAKEAIPFLRRFRRPILTVPEDVTTAGTFLARAVMQRIADASKAPMQGLEIPKFQEFT